MNVNPKKVAIITGAAGGIGTALCKAFCDEGYHVVGSDRVKTIDGIACHVYVQANLDDICVDDKIRTEVISKLREALGGRSLSVIVNNAAIQEVKPFEQISIVDWARTLNINLIAPFLLIQAFLPELEEAAGSVINISSIHATQTKQGFSLYATSKCALSGLTRSLAVELGRRVRVNAICPAAIATPMLVDGFKEKPSALAELEGLHPVGHIGAPQDVATLALFLASGAARFINGAEVGLDGGIRACLHDPL